MYDDILCDVHLELDNTINLQYQTHHSKRNSRNGSVSKFQYFLNLNSPGDVIMKDSKPKIIFFWGYFLRSF